MNGNSTAEILQRIILQKKSGVRKAGSCRFATYYKVQWFDLGSLSWRDVQRCHKTKAEAEANFLSKLKCRVIEVSESGRKPV